MIAPPTLDPLSRRDRFGSSRSLLDRLHPVRSGLIRRAVVASAIAWLPAMIMVALHGQDYVKSFLSDFAAQSRLLFLIPLLIVTEPLVVAQLKTVAYHFVAAGLINKENLPRFQKQFAIFEQQGRSVIARVFIVVLIYTFAAYALSTIRQGHLQLPMWCYAGTAGSGLSNAACWYIFAAVPFLLYLLLLWVWRQSLWGRFLWSVSHMDLRLVPAHPDLMGGLGFVQTYLRAYLPFGFAVGTIAGGGIANRVIHLHQPMLAFQHLALAVIAFVLVLCVGPLFAFFVLLVRTKTVGIFEYGTLGSGLGHQFETKWLGHDREVDATILDKPDFSATIDLYSVVAYVHQMNFLPVNLQYLLALTVATLLPAIPIALFSVPFDVLMERTMKLVL